MTKSEPNKTGRRPKRSDSEPIKGPLTNSMTAKTVDRTPPTNAASARGMSPISCNKAGITGMIRPKPMASSTSVITTKVSVRFITAT